MWHCKLGILFIYGKKTSHISDMITKYYSLCKTHTHHLCFCDLWIASNGTVPDHGSVSLSSSEFCDLWMVSHGIGHEHGSVGLSLSVLCNLWMDSHGIDHEHGLIYSFSSCFI